MNINLLNLFFIKLSSEQKQSYKLWKMERYIDFYTILPIGGALLILSLWGWDLVIDRSNAFKTLEIRLVMALILVISATLPHFKTKKLFIYILAFVFVCLIEVHLYVVILKNLKNGLEYGFPGFLYWYIFSPISCLFLPFEAVIITMFLVGIYPNFLSYFEFISNFDLKRYNTIIWPAWFTIILLCYVLEKLNQKLFLTSKENETLRDYDALTGLFNRRKLFSIANDLIKNATKATDSTAIVVFDIDNFKVINDKYGHPIGDQAIKHIARLISESLRGTDVFGRFGGDEFIIILPNTSQVQALDIMERIKSIIEMTPIFHQETINFTISTGITTYMDHDKDIDDAIVRADTALYKAKKLGKNQVIIEQ